MEVKGNLYAGAGSSATGTTSFSFGNNTYANGNYSHAEGNGTTASGQASHVEGNGTTASGLYSHAEGDGSKAIGQTAHAEGTSTIASGNYSHAEGQQTTASGDYSHAEGSNTTASGNYSHAQGYNSKASGESSQANGGSFNLTVSGGSASGVASRAEGGNTTASGNYSYAGGYGSRATNTTSFIHSTNSTVSGARSAVLGGQNITGTTADTVYVPNFETRGGSVFNQDGGNFDFRVEGDTNQHLIFVDASTDRVGINSSAPDSKLSIASLKGDGISFDGMTNASLVGKHKFYTKQSEISTTSANTSTIATISLVGGDRITLRGMITAIGTGTLVVGGTFSAVGSNVAGTASIIGTVDTSIKSANSLGSPTFTVSASGGNIIITVTGGGENTQWATTYEYQIVSASEA
jgi:hypothetical protein